MMMTNESKNLPLISTIVRTGEVRQYGKRKGTIVEKGIVLNEKWLLKYEDKLQKKFSYYCAYPDMYVSEILTPTDSNFQLLFTQRILMRAMMRCEAVHFTASRGMSKTFVSVLILIIKCIFQPGAQIAMSAPTKSQAAAVGGAKINEILRRFPYLNNEIEGKTQGKDYVTIRFKNGSTFQVIAPLESTRGLRFSTVLCDEARDYNGEDINSIILPTLVIDRRTVKGLYNPYEPRQTKIFTSSASSKSSYNYEKLYELFVDSIIHPKRTMICGIDYRVAIKEGLMTRAAIEKMRLDPTFSPDSFARKQVA